MNTLTYAFGPEIPVNLEAIGLSFLAAPHLQSDSSIAVLSAERYVRENYAHKRLNSLYSGAIGQVINVNITYRGTDVNGLYDVDNVISLSGQVTLTDGHFYLESLHSPIKVSGMGVSDAGTWQPIIQPGCVWRKHIIKSYEPTDSWLTRTGGAGLVTDEEVYLIYTVPEIKYGTLSTYGSSNTFPGSEVMLRQVKELSTIFNPTQLTYTLDIKVIQEIKINGVVKFSGNYDGTVEDSYIRAIDKNTRIIDIKDSLGPDDTVELTYLTYADFYMYTGYRNYTNNWLTFDANPEYGHFIHDYKQNELRASSDCLQEQVTVYLIPSAFVKVNILTDETSGTTIINLEFDSAFNYGETHFVRHIVGQNDEDIVGRQNDGPVNSWGYAVFNRNFYDEASSYEDDIFSKDIPSMMPLGKIVLAAAAAVNSVPNADIRQRGGGVPEDFPIEHVAATGDGLDTLRGYWDLGIWDGKAYKEGGVAQISIDPSVLDEFSESEVYEIVKSRVPPGIDFEIVYTST